MGREYCSSFNRLLITKARDKNPAKKLENQALFIKRTDYQHKQLPTIPVPLKMQLQWYCLDYAKAAGATRLVWLPGLTR
jgi:hypothetical protein